MTVTQTLRSFALLLVFLAFAGLLVRFLLPDNRVSETAKTVISVILLTCVLSPLFGLLQNAEEALPSLPAGREEALSVDAGVYAAAGERTVRRLVEEQVAAFTDVPYRTEISVHIGEDLRINIDRVRLVFDRRFPEMTDLAFALRNTLGMDPVLETEEPE